ncbi:Transcriptional regulatory protein FixJ [Hartmannibacter diazotrophicus]|uniref:Transcriptional regulatory protein FixJ n=1 Tax=Hartmannibacter diazotrophicus TaxID=1482074 RepID=A0A2C9DCA0_9HYPH|nr:response regulator [Hartmannibacter diazotrophicus]SON57800.1 Transcriptional regulatory protein FixJ [Hartmannibacter diazotrophicus]
MTQEENGGTSHGVGGRVLIVDDDEAIRDSLTFLFSSRGLVAESFASGEAFLDRAKDDAPVCIVMDIRMTGIGGIECFDRFQQDGGTDPVIFLTGHADVPLAVEALKKGAFDFVEKPFNDNALVESVIAGLNEAQTRYMRTADRDALATRLKSLTPRERQVLDHLLEGRFNKQIADGLGISMRTVEVHRSRVFEKMGVRNAVELSRLLVDGSL